MRKLFFFFLLILFTVSAVHAQQFPVQVTSQLIPPYTTQVSDYFSPSQANAKLNLLLLNRDFNKPVLNVRLRMSIESQGIRMRSKEDNPGAFTTLSLNAGVPYYVTPSQLAQYFNINNLEISGMSPQEYTTVGKLPEGFYTFCFEVVEVSSGQTVSNKGCTFAWMNLNDPPMLNLPVKGESVVPSVSPGNQLVYFAWTPRQTSSPVATYTTLYIFTLAEIIDSTVAPEAAFLSSPPLYTDSTTSTNYIYDGTKIGLIPGKKYAWRVQAKTKDGISEVASFKNNGYSEIFWFNYKTTCPLVTNVGSAVLGKRATISWIDDPQHLDYKVIYLETNNSKAEWFTVITTGTQTNLNDLKSSTEYQYRVGASCDQGVYTFSPTYNFTTLDSTKTSVPDCGTDPALTNPGNISPLPTMERGDSIKAGDFKVIVTTINGSNGTFSGEGYVVVSYLAGMKLAVVFNGIGVNTDKKLISGQIQTTYDPTEGGIESVDDYIDYFTAGYGVGNVVTGAVKADTTFNFSIGTITKPTPWPPANYNATTGTITGGGTIPFTITPAGNGSAVTYNVEKLPVTIMDKDGSVYQVDKSGTVTKIGTAGGDKLIKTITPALIDDDKALVKFIPHPTATFAFDEWKPVYKNSTVFNKEYERIRTASNGDYYVSAKAIAPAVTDVIKAKITLVDNTINPDSVKFVSGKGIIYTATVTKSVSDTTYEISIMGGPEKDAQEIYAVYQQAGKKTLNLGKLLVASYQRKDYNVRLVRINGGNTNIDSIRNKLNKIYNCINVFYNVQFDDDFTSDSWDLNNDGQLDIASSNSFTTMSGEMKKIISNYRHERVIDNTALYFFICKRNSDIGVIGAMPRGSRFGFLFDSATLKDNGAVIAHEIAHGQFNLKHTFDGYGYSQSDLTDNLLNYGGGKSLYKFQWDLINDPAIVFGMFDNDEDNRFVNIGIKAIEKFKNKAPNTAWDGTFTFLATSGRPITLPKDIVSVQFDTFDPFSGSNNKLTGPIGGLNGFKTSDGKFYTAQASSGNFLYYKESGGQIYIDVFSRSANPASAMVAFGWFENEDLGFDIFQVPLLSQFVIKPAIDKYELDYKAEGLIPKNAFTVVDDVFPLKIIDPAYIWQNPDEIDNTVSVRMASLRSGNEGKVSVIPSPSDVSPLSEVGRSYLRMHQEYSKRGSIYSPVLVATAYWISQTFADENVVSCELASGFGFDPFNTAIDQIKLTQPLINIDDQEISSISNGELQFLKEYHIQYNKFRTDIDHIKSISPNTVNINAVISNSTTAPPIVNALKDKDICLFEKIGFENRIKAIELCDVADEQSTIIKLIQSCRYNGQSQLLMNKIFESNSRLFFKLWNTMDGGDFVKFISYFKTITEHLSLGDDRIDNNASFGFYSTSPNTPAPILSYGYDMKPELNLIKIYGTTVNPGERIEIASFKPNEFVTIQFVANSPYIVFDETQAAKSIKVPAFYISYLIWAKNKSDQATALKAVRILADVVGIALAIPSGGTSLTVVAGIGLFISSTDIVMTLSEDELKKSSLGTELWNVWNDYIVWADIAAAGVNGVTKLTTAVGRAEVKFTIQQFSQNLRDNIKEALFPLNSLRSSLFKLEQMGFSYHAALLRQKMLTLFDEILLQKSFQHLHANGTADMIKIRNLSEGVIQFENNTYKLFDLEFTSQGFFFKNVTFGTVNATDELVGRIYNLKRVETTTGNMITENVEVYFNRIIGKMVIKSMGSPFKIITTDVRAAITARINHITKIIFEPKSVGYRFSGCHSNSALVELGTNARIEITIPANSAGVYEARVFAKGPDGVEILKSGNGGKSTFFPENWTEQRILNETDFAIRNNKGLIDATDASKGYFGFSKDGNVKIGFYYRATDGFIGSFFPILP